MVRPRRPRSVSAALLAGLLGLAGLPGCAGTSSSSAVAVPPVPISRELALETFETAWQTVEESHFDETFNGVDWVAVREEMLPRVEAATTRDEVREIVREMLGRLGQSHFELLPAEALPTEQGIEEGVTPEAIAGGCGIDLRLREGALLVNRVDPDGPAAQAGVRAGWSLVRLDDLEVDGVLEDLSEMEPREVAMRISRRFLQASYGPVDSLVDLGFVDGRGEEVAVEIARAPRPVHAHNFGTNLPTFYLRFEEETFERDGRRIGWIHFTNWFLPMMQPMNAAVDSMRQHDGIVIDLRGNSGGAGAMTMGFAGNFFTERVEFGIQTQRDSEVRYVAMPRLIDTEGELVEPYAGPVAILVDETTGSASEVFSGGMQAVDRMRVFGETSAGAVLPARLTTLPNGDAILHAFGDFKTADGTLLEGRGVVPDEVVPLTREELLRGRDPQLEAALAWIAAHGRS